jgi:hypothetical protein
MASEEIERDEALWESGLVPDWLRIQSTPPTLAPGSIQFAEVLLVSQKQAEGGGVLDDEALAGLAESGWLRQDVQVRGFYVSTFGLQSRRDHPELVMMNVPSGAMGWAIGVLGEMAFYLDNSPLSFGAGGMFSCGDLTSHGAFTFEALTEKAAESIGFEHLPDEFRLVIPLP